MSTYERIADLCKKNGISVTGLEAELGFGRGSIGKMKKGSSTSYDRLQKIADRFGVTVEYLVNEEETEPQAAVQTNEQEKYYLDEKTIATARALLEKRGLRILFDAAKDISDEDLYLVYDLLKRFKKESKDE